MKNKEPLFLNIEDKIMISRSRVCPAHYFPHKLPFGKPIENEPCHLHKKTWRMLHHIIFCKYLKCPNYKFMIENYRNFNKN